MISKMRPPEAGGSRIGIVFNGSPLFTGDAGSGESNIRRWIIENDWLEAIVALPEQLFYNTGIATYVWIVTNKKEKRRKGKVHLIDARNFWVQMEKSLGNKRRRIGDPAEKAKDPDHIAEITRIHTDFRDGQTRAFKLNGRKKKLVVSKVFDNEDFGYHKITVERPLRLNFQAVPERIARLEEQTAFKNLAASKKKNETVRRREIEAGKARQQAIRDLMAAFEETHDDRLFMDREAFLNALKQQARENDLRLAAPELKTILAALGERDETAEICWNTKGDPEPDAELRDTENVPLKERIEDYFQREVLPHVPDAWIDESKTMVGYEIPLNRHFYRYEPPRPLDQTRIIEEIGGGYTEFQEGDVVVAKITPCFENGKGAIASALVNGAAYGTTELHVLRSSKCIKERFLFYLTITSGFRRYGEAEMYGAGGQKRVPTEFCKNLDIPLPSLNEQTTIANFLDRETGRLDTLIAKKQALIGLLKGKRTALISQTVTRGLPPDAAREFGLKPHACFKNSGIDWLGEVPEGWKIVPLGYLVRLHSGATPDKSNIEFWDGAIPWVSPKDMKVFKIVDTQDHITTEALKGSTLKLFPVDTVLIVVRGMILAHSFPVALTAKPLTINQDMKALSCLDRITPSFLVWSLIGIETAVTRLQEYRTALITAAVTGKIDVRNHASSKEAA